MLQCAVVAQALNGLVEAGMWIIIYIIIRSIKRSTDLPKLKHKKLVTSISIYFYLSVPFTLAVWRPCIKKPRIYDGPLAETELLHTLHIHS